MGGQGYTYNITLTFRSLIKQAILHDEAVTVDELETLLNESDLFPSHFLIAEVRRAFRSDLKFLRAMGMLDKIDKSKLEPLPIRESKPVSRPVRFYYDE